MRIRYAIVLIAAFTFISCDRTQTTDRGRSEPAARQAGREAYDASREIKHGAQQAARDLRSASKEFRQGWNERRAERRDQPPPRRDH